METDETKGVGTRVLLTVRPAPFIFTWDEAISRWTGIRVFQGSNPTFTEPFTSLFTGG
jgi:hypothetical protein